MTDHSNRLLRNTILYLPAQFLPPAVQFATTIAWTYLLDPAIFGIVTFVIAAQEVSAYIGITAWSLFVLRYRTRFRSGEEERFRRMDNRMTLYASVVQIVLTFPILMLLGVSLQPDIFIATAAYLATRTLLVHYGEWARADHLIGVYTTSQLIGSVAGSSLSVLAILFFGPYAAVALGAQALGQLVALIVLFRQTGLRAGFGKFDSSIFTDVWRYGAPLIISGVVGWGASNIIRVLVQYWEGPVALGLLSVGWGIGQRISAVLAMLFTAAAYPLAVHNLERGDRKGALAQVSLNGVFLLAILTPALVGAATLTRPIVTLLIAESFRETTIVILPIAMFAASIRFLRLHTSDQTMLLLERTDVSMWVTVTETALNIALCSLGLHLGGLYGAALGMLIGTSLACVGGFAYSFALLGLPPPAPWTCLRILLAVGVMSCALRVLPTPATISALTLTIAVGALAYASAIVLAFPECRALLTRQLKRFSGAPVL